MNIILSALTAIPVSELSYSEWIRIGMALHAEGLDYNVWENWSKNDSRYRPGECLRKWNSFHGSGTPVTGGTIIQMAKDRGWKPSAFDPSVDWKSQNQEIKTKNNGIPEPSKSPTEELITYLELIFEADDYVSYVTNDVWQNKDGKWLPAKGACDRTAKELIVALKQYPDDIGAVLGDWKEEAGGWIRFNSVDTHGIKNENITRFKYALVESDTMTIEEQYAVYRKLELPITCLVHSGGKSLHAIVRVDASDINEYYRRVDYLYKYLQDRGISIDTQNRNPSRLSRMPGVTRNGNRQYLVATHMGKATWSDWLTFTEQQSDELPNIVSLEQCLIDPPALPEELIEGVLRCNHKLLIAGSSKVGKSFLLLQLVIAIAEGMKWLGFQCKKGRVLYINLEIGSASCINRFQEIYAALGIEPKHKENIQLWNLRGYAIPLDELVPKLINRIKNQNIDAIILDPIYKVITGDENNATEMGRFCNLFDRICTETGAAVIYCHHHSKGVQGAKRALDRASGSGVFGRDPDACLDIVELQVPQSTRKDELKVATAWRMECSLREFANFKPVNFWFDYPLHRLDTTGALEKAEPEGSILANLAKSPKRTSEEERRERLETAFAICSLEPPPIKVKRLAAVMEVSTKTVERYLNEFQDDFWWENGLAGRKIASETKDKKPMSD